MPWLAAKTASDRVKTAATHGAVFASAFTVSLAVQWFPMFRDPDSFYHLKMALLMRDYGIVRDFPWLPFTTLAERYADHHFLYHALLIPFVSAFGSFQGMLVATSFLAATAVTLFHILLRAYGIKNAAAYTFILGTASAFLFRLDLAKASALSLSLIFLALLAIRKRSPLALFAVSWVYVLSYGGWPIVLVVVGSFALARLIVDRAVDVHPWNSWAHTAFWRRLFSRRSSAWAAFISADETRLTLATLAGVTCGLVVNPYFPVNLWFYWEQIVQIALIGHREAIGVGSEWYPYTIDRLVGESGGAFLLWMITLALFAFMIFWPETVKRGRGRISREELAPIIASSILTALFLALALRSKRNMEYLVPFMVFSAALALQSLRERLDLSAARAQLTALFPRAAAWYPAFASALIAVFLFVGIRDVILVRNLYADGIPWNQYQGAAAWIAARAPVGAVVMHSDWDDFPPLFYRDADRRYIAGLDPTFFYRADPERYWLWVEITTGRMAQPARVVKERFGAEYVIIETDHQPMIDAFQADPLAQWAYADADAVIFVIL